MDYEETKPSKMSYLYHILVLKKFKECGILKAKEVCGLKEEKNNYLVDVEIGNAKFLITMSKLFSALGDEETQVVHSHVGFEIHVISDGDASLETERGSIPLKKGETLILPPGFVHERLSFKNGIKTSFSFTLRKCQSNSKSDMYSHIKSVLSATNEPKIIVAGNKHSDYLERIFFEYYSKRYFSNERMLSLFRLLITDIISDLEALIGQSAEKEGTIQTDSYMLVSAAMEEYVTGRFNRSPSLEELARIVHLGPRQASRVFSQCFGVSFSEYIKRRRLDSAKYLLVNTDKSFGAIAAESGYHSYNGFYKIFKNSVGVSPEEYRKTNRRE